MLHRKLIIVVAVGLVVFNHLFMPLQSKEKIIVLLGSAGSGKGTIAQALTYTGDYAHVNSGDILREAIKKGDPQGDMLAHKIRSGEKIDDTIVATMVQDKIKQLLNQKKTIILEGFPNNLAQAQSLDTFLVALSINDASFIHVKVAADEARNRILTRKICNECNKIYNIKTQRPTHPDTCTICNGNLITRSDDHEACVDKRIATYAFTKDSLLEYYKNHQRFIEIDGNQSIPQVHNQVLNVLGINPKPIAPNIPCFFIEGATGVGKTTFTELISKNIPGALTVYEPVDKFIDVNGAGNILDLFFTNPNRWTFTTEVYISLMHMKAVEDQIKNSAASVAIVDRSMFADCYVYGKMAHRLGTMNHLEWEVYQQLMGWIAKNTTAPHRGFIYLQTSPQTALERVQKRGRAGEESVSLNYQENLHNLYQEWFIEHKEIPDDLARIPVLIIDATENFKDDPVIQQKCIDRVKAFIKEVGQEH